MSVSKLSENDFLDVLYFVLRQIEFVNEEQISVENKEKVKALVADVDPKDVSFVSLALEANALLWSGDKKLYKGLRAKGFLDIVNTPDLLTILQS